MKDSIRLAMKEVMLNSEILHLYEKTLRRGGPNNQISNAIKEAIDEAIIQVINNDHIKSIY